MPLVLTRIDDRLIHGQVVIGWGNQIRPHRIILCSDSIAASQWQRELYMSAGSMAMYDVDISIMSEDETVDFLKNKTVQEEKVILLVESPRDVYRLIKRQAPIHTVNVGGMHYKRGKRQLANYIFVNDEDVQSFRRLLEKNIVLEGQDVPTSKKIDIAKLLESVE